MCWLINSAVDCPILLKFGALVHYEMYEMKWNEMKLYIWHYSGPCSDVHHLGHSKNYWTELNWTESAF